MQYEQKINKYKIKLEFKLSEINKYKNEIEVNNESTLKDIHEKDNTIYNLQIKITEME